MNIIKTEWRSGVDTVGIVLIKNDQGRYKAYIGVAKNFDEDYDAEYIAANGAKLSLDEALAFFPSDFNPDDYN